jgi:hypothetical protein
MFRPMNRRLEPLGTYVHLERTRLRHDYDPAPITDADRFIVRDRTDGEPGVVVILADTDKDYREYHLGPSEIEDVVRALTTRSGQAD